ncbi:hypothetical protein [Paenibacillus foliorum]|uniref:hypothetical protein n=1 Tax=Paenibacillus foliorum TaxID=2654974 RepID=UPI00149094E3|nr:hypothetical protein [Paenibacillus foliorum]
MHEFTKTPDKTAKGCIDAGFGEAMDSNIVLCTVIAIRKVLSSAELGMEPKIE